MLFRYRDWGRSHIPTWRYWRVPFAWRQNRIVFNKSRAYVITLRGCWDKAAIGQTTLSAGFRRAGQNQFDLSATTSWRCFRLNFRSKSGQNSFKTLAAMSTPSSTPSLDTALEADRLSL